MRPFETYLGVACVVAVLWPALFGVRPRRGIVTGSLVVLLVVQWQVEGYRWPLFPLYLATLALAVGDFITIERSLTWTRRLGRALFGLLGLGFVFALPLLFPVPSLPVPSGPLAIGTTIVELQHAELVETYGSGGGLRRIKTQVWYPGLPREDARPITWEPDIDVVAPALARRVGVPPFLFNSARHTRTHSYPDAPVDEGGFPLVVFSHGWEGFRVIALPQIENLVSQGYVVVAIDHTYGAVATVLDGEAVHLDPDALGAEDADEEARMEATSALVATFAADILLVLDEVEAGAEGAYAELAGAIDESVVGLWGHGLGGGAALQACLTDERCDAVAGLDPWAEALPDPILATTATKPMLFMRSDPMRGTTNDAVLQGVVARSETVTYIVDVFGADPSDFVATPLFSPVASNLGLRGPIDAARVQIINRRFVTGFFDRFLLGTGPAALDTASFEEVEVEVFDQTPG